MRYITTLDGIWSLTICSMIFSFAPVAWQKKRIEGRKTKKMRKAREREKT